MVKKTRVKYNDDDRDVSKVEHDYDLDVLFIQTKKGEKYTEDYKTAGTSTPNPYNWLIPATNSDNVATSDDITRPIHFLKGGSNGSLKVGYKATDGATAVDKSGVMTNRGTLLKNFYEGKVDDSINDRSQNPFFLIIVPEGNEVGQTAAIAFQEKLKTAACIFGEHDLSKLKDANAGNNYLTTTYSSNPSTKPAVKYGQIKVVGAYMYQYDGKPILVSGVLQYITLFFQQYIRENKRIQMIAGNKRGQCNVDWTWTPSMAQSELLELHSVVYPKQYEYTGPSANPTYQWMGENTYAPSESQLRSVHHTMITFQIISKCFALAHKYVFPDDYDTDIPISVAGLTTACMRDIPDNITITITPIRQKIDIIMKTVQFKVVIRFPDKVHSIRYNFQIENQKIIATLD